MNEINDSFFYECFNSLFTSPNHISQVKFSAKIEDINTSSEEMTLTVKCLDKNGQCFKGLYAIKGETFPLPKNKDFIEIFEMQLKLSSNLNIGIFIKFSETKNKYLT